MPLSNRDRDQLNELLDAARRTEPDKAALDQIGLIQDAIDQAARDEAFEEAQDERAAGAANIGGSDSASLNGLKAQLKALEASIRSPSAKRILSNLQGTV